MDEVLWRKWKIRLIAFVMFVLLSVCLMLAFYAVAPPPV
jgi:uncharacterized membrane protein